MNDDRNTSADRTATILQERAEREPDKTEGTPPDAEGPRL